MMVNAGWWLGLALFGTKPALAAQDGVVDVSVDETGQLRFEGEPLRRGEFRSTVAEQASANPGATWLIHRDPDAAQGDVNWVVGVLTRAGATQFSIVAEDVAPPPDSTPAVATVPVTAAAPLSMRPSGEVRFDLAADRLDTFGADDDLADMAFRLTRFVVGLDGDYGRFVSTRARFNIVERHDTSIYSVDGAASDTVQVQVDDFPAGTSLRLRDVYMDFKPAGDDRYRLRAGVQMPIFGTRDFFDNPEHGYYTVGPVYQTIAEAVGVELGRDLGVSGQARFGDRLVLDAMASNGAPRSTGEDNSGKDVSGRLTYNLTDQLRVLASGLYGARAGDDTLGTWDVGVEWRAERLRVLAEYLDGTWTRRGTGEHFLGGQGALWAGLPVSGSALERVGVATRAGYYDPHADTLDADSWILWNVGLQAWWTAPEGQSAMTGLGYQVIVPIDVTAPVEHAAVLQARWAF